MKSKSLDLKRDSGSMGKSKKPFDFISLYKSAAETNNIIEKHKAEGRLDKENSYTESKHEPKLENLPKMKKKKKLHEPLDISQINIEGPALDGSNRISSLNESKVTSTPRSSNEHKNQVKSIMKNSSNMHDSTTEVEESKILSNIKSKKRNKSVSFMLDDNEEVAKKKTKSEDSLINEKQTGKLKHKKKSLCKFQNIKKPKVLEVEKASVGDTVSDIIGESSSKSKAPSNGTVNQDKKKKDKKCKKPNTPMETDTVASTPDNNTNVFQNKKKLNKKNHKLKVTQLTTPTDDEEPAAKSRKTDVKPEAITQNLENLSIGDNAHTLTSLLDEMTVVDKNKKKKTKRKHKKNKGFTSISSTENGDVENVAKEKVKWRRKWNKDKKGEVNDDTTTSVIVENLSLSLMCVYKTVLSEHFSKYGLIKKVGDNEEVAKKKTKSEDSLINEKQTGKLKHKKKSLCKFQNIKKPKVLEVEKASVGDTVSDIIGESSSKSKAPSNGTGNQDKKKKDKKCKKPNTPMETDTVASTPDNNTNVFQNKKKLNKKNHKLKVTQLTTPTDDEEPAAKSRKTDVKPEAITQNLENLSIGDNAHTLTSLLDEMTVVDKNKKKKTKRKHKKNKSFTSISSTENGDVENVAKEKVKWRRKWNKDKKGEVNDDTTTSVIVENLSLSLMCVSKTVLSEHFSKYGLIKKVGVAEMYPGDSNMTFTTTINFYSDGAATQALEENGVNLEGSCIRVKRPLPPTQTTAVVRSYASLSDQAICTAFSSAGKIRSIRHLIKGKKSIGDTVFIEFDGPEAVQRALELANGAKMAGKKLHVAKFEIRKKNSRPKPTTETGNEGDSEGGDSDNSDD